MILDFNSDKLKFSVSKLSDYNVDVIFKNIDNFKKFIYDSVITDTFEKVYTTELFQITLLDETTNYIDNLLITYNAIAKTLSGENLPEISSNQLKEQLKIRGYTIRRTSRRILSGKYETAYKAIMEEKPW